MSTRAVSEPGDTRDDAGLTLVELLVTIVLMGVASLTIFAALATFFAAAASQRATANLDQAVRIYSEQLQSTSYVACATSYSIALPSGFSATNVTVKFWNGDNPATFKPTCGADPGLQQVTATVNQSTTGRTQTVVLVKRQQA
jgi:prepilin-type N-terminal cleavage/methylation domain-containing protein